ncbi:hypothetical protein HUJ05_002732 [Dendroctonus ponderosae]|nr:hypothetical protein HUJ05_002732 [Dendroctonus ponderosae]
MDGPNHKVLLALVIAKTEGRNEIVNVILKSKSQKASVPIDSVHQITVPNHADSDPTLYSVQYSSSSSDTADFSSARTDSADATMFDAFLAPNESTFAQENAADMSLSLPEPSFGSENYAFCSGTSDDINIYNESKVCVNSTRCDSCNNSADVLRDIVLEQTVPRKTFNGCTRQSEGELRQKRS